MAGTNKIPWILGTIGTPWTIVTTETVSLSDKYDNSTINFITLNAIILNDVIYF